MPVFRDSLGKFVDLKDGKGLRFLLTDEEIEWVQKTFFLMQFARDDFVVKYSCKSHLSPERIKQREEEKNKDKRMFVPMLCSKSKQIIDSKDSSSSRSLYLKLQKSPHTETKERPSTGGNWSFSSMVDYGKVTRELHK